MKHLNILPKNAPKINSTRSAILGKMPRMPGKSTKQETSVEMSAASNALLTVDALQARDNYFKKSTPLLLEPYVKGTPSTMSTTATSASGTLSNTEDLFNKFVPFASGGMGQLIRALDKESKKEVLIKTVKKDKNMKKKDVEVAYQSLVDEFAMQSVLSHENILEAEKLVGSASCGDKRCIVLPKLNGIDLFDFIAQDKFVARGLTPAISEDISAPLMKQMLAAVAHCHEKGIAHRDIKPENFVFETATKSTEDSKSATLKMIDFGGAAYTGVAPGCVESTDEWINYKIHPGCYTPGYAAPEQLTKGSNYSMQVDNWAIGIIFFQMFHKCLPVHLLGGETGCVKTMEKIPQYLSSFFEISDKDSNCCGKDTCKGIPTARKSNKGEKALISKKAYCLMSQLLTLDSHERITAQDAVEHPFLR